jgi:hypothetical protein
MTVGELRELLKTWKDEDLVAVATPGSVDWQMVWLTVEGVDDTFQHEFSDEPSLCLITAGEFITK